MRAPLFSLLTLAVGLSAVTCRAAPNPEFVSLGHDTYSVTRWASNGFTRHTDKLKEQALEDAEAYCAKLHRELKVIETTTDRPAVPLTGFASAKVVFKALDAGDPELHAPVSATESGGAHQESIASAPPRTETDVLYSDLMKLDDLRKRGVLTEEEFKAQKAKLLEKSN